MAHHIEDNKMNCNPNVEINIDPDMKCKCSHCGTGEIRLRSNGPGGDVYQISCDNPECKVVFNASGMWTEVQLIDYYQRPEKL
jgi:hypothetical protein